MCILFLAGSESDSDFADDEMSPAIRISRDDNKLVSELSQFHEGPTSELLHFYCTRNSKPGDSNLGNIMVDYAKFDAQSGVACRRRHRRPASCGTCACAGGLRRLHPLRASSAGDSDQEACREYPRWPVQCVCVSQGVRKWLPGGQGIETPNPHLTDKYFELARNYVPPN